jgi:hypothetical protein
LSNKLPITWIGARSLLETCSSKFWGKHPHDEDHRAALEEIDARWGATEGTESGDELDILLALVEIYEAKRWPIEPMNACCGAGANGMRQAA